MASLAVCAAAWLQAAGTPAQQVAADAPPLTEASARALKNPVGNTSQSIGRGKLLYTSLGCADCHGRDGKALIEVVANATDLTSPEVWKNGTDEGLIFRSIRDGAGLAMPPFKTQVGEPGDIWHLVNFIRSLWPEGRRPPVAAAPANNWLRVLAVSWLTPVWLLVRCQLGHNSRTERSELVGHVQEAL